MTVAAPWRRRYGGGPPFEEVWFLEGSLDERRGFWLRYTLTARPDGGSQAVWAAIVDESGATAARVCGELVHPPPSGAVHEGPAARLTPRSAAGAAGEVRWDLHFHGGWHHHDHVPQPLARLGLSGRHYRSAALDLAVSGTLEAGGRTWRLDHAPAVAGHIFGARSTTDGWAWAHCAAFQGRPDVIFEGIAARLRPVGLPLPPATSLVLRHRGQTHRFTRVRQLFTTGCDLDARSWRFSARSRALTLQGEARLPAGSSCVRVRYDHANGRTNFVTNSPLSTLRLSLLDHATGQREALSSDRASFERVERTDPGEPPHLSG